MKDFGYEIIDFHTHPFSDRDENICDHIDHCDMSEENMVRDMQEAGISRMCGSVIVRRDLLSARLGVRQEDLSAWELISACNASMLEIEKKLNGFYIPGMQVHPDFVSESCDEIERMYAKGIRLIGELVPYFHGWRDYSCDGFSKIIDFATEKNMIISLHSMGEDEMDEMVRKHPDTKFVFAHPGEKTEFYRHINRIAMSKNAYLDVSGYGIFRHGMLRTAIDELGADRLLFGSDYPTCNPYMYVGGVLLDPMITEEERKKIFSENAKTLFASVGKII